MADNRKSVNLLPDYLKSDKNSKFLSGTIDPLIQSPQLERIDGFVGSKLTPNYDATKDFYIKEDSALRTNYSLDPALVLKDASSKIIDVIAFDDIINEIGIQGGKTNDLDRLFRSKFYSYDPYINWDKLVNYSQYYWLPNGPDSILIDESVDVETDIIGQSSYTMPNDYNLSNGMKIKFSLQVTPVEYRDKEYYVEGVGNSIKLIDIKLLEVNELANVAYNETFDSDKFDSYPFDGDKKLPLTAEYTTINRASTDLNPWSRYNRWFHSEIIRITSIINNQAFLLPLDSRAQRPIIEFKPNLQLYNFGITGIEKITVIDTDTTNSFSSVDGTIGYYVDGVLLEHGNTIIFNADTDDNVRGKIYTVNYDISTNPATLRLVDPITPNNLDSIAINYGTTNAGTCWHYNSAIFTWIYSQQHTTINQAPLFNLYDRNGISYSDTTSYDSDFAGSKIFGYDVGTGTSDTVLGFPLKYKNSVGVGSYLFKNYFMTDSINVISNGVSSAISTRVTYFKLFDTDSLKNVWHISADYQIPVIEIQTILTATTTTTILSINPTLTVSVIATVNSVLTPVTLSTPDLTLTFDKTLNVNDIVSLKITSDQLPNSNGFYDTPLGLTNNPLNGPIYNFTLSELSDHVSSMIGYITDFSGAFPGLSNLRDFDDYSKYGTRLIINANPIAFAKLFLGKKDHNVVDAIRHAADQYNQFKMNLLKAIVEVDGQLTPADALDQIITDINNKSSGSPYYRSDMLGYGFNKTIRTYTVSNSNTTHYPIGLDFDLTALSFKSVLVYINDIQLVNGVDYSFAVDEIIISTSLLVGDVISIHYYPDTLGSFIPSTPSKLGLYPTYAPMIYNDDSYLGSDVTVIRGHDGSIMKAYGDYRDAIILEYEKRVYNNIKVNYDSTIFDVNAVIPGKFRQDKYLLSDVNEILIKDFIKWTGAYNIDVTTNNIYDEGNPFTWNYKNCVSTDVSISGYWRGIYNYLYDTDRPDTHPWEMLGHSSKPAWWDTYYSWIDSDKRTALIAAITNGYTKEPLSTFVNSNYVRPDFASICPVDISGALVPPSEILTTDNSYYDKISNWEFGDQGPAETAWRKSSFWPFALNAAAALIDPCTYTSSMYDTSRTELNALTGQLTYLTDNIYLNPNKLLIEGYNNEQTAGFSVYVVEKGLQKNLNYISSLKQDLTYIDFNLFHKVGGFVSKDKLQVVIDSIDPLSQSPGAILPPENYTLILNVSNPIKSTSISGVIVQKSNGKFVIKGYDKSNPYFNILSPIKTSAAGALTVGGKSEAFTEWTGAITASGLGSIDMTAPTPNTTRYYKQGQIVRYNNRYYRVKVGHATQSTFDTTLFYPLPSLPMVGGSTVQTSLRFENTVTKITYGSSFSTIQEIYDIIVGYGAYLEKQGFIFDEFNADLGEVIDWKYTGKEFLYWTTQNWADGNLITLSPFADYLKYSYTDSIVDNISTGDYEYSLLKADGKSFPIDKFRLSREDGICVINTIDTSEGMFFATLNSVQKEHGMIIDNTTIFNDTIYDVETGYKQRRIKLSGFRTAGWNGDLSSPGFVYDSIDITDWAPYTLYLPGNVVRYNGAYYESNVKVVNDSTFDFNKWDKLNSKPVSNLLPNFDYKIKQFEDFYSLDIDNFDVAQQQLAQHLIGYTPRAYLNSIITDPIAQYKFYQGFIKEKGTKNAIDKLSKVGKFTNQGSVSFNEEWAFRVGQYGSFVTYNELEVELTEGTSLENPYVVKFVNTTPTDSNPLISYKLPSDLLLAPDEYIPTSTFNTYPSTFSDTNLELTTAGYVRADDVTATAYNKNSLLDIANNSLIQEGNTIWLGFLENGDWTVYRYSNQAAKIAGVYISSPAVDITFTTDINHKLSVGDVVSIVRFNDQVNGIHIVTAIPRLDQFTVASSLTTISNADLLSNGSLFKFEEARYNNIQEVINSGILSKLNVGEKVWVDSGVGDKWQVYEKVENFNIGYVSTASISVPDQQFGYTIYSQEASNKLLMASIGKRTTAPTYGNISVYFKNKNLLDKRLEYTLNSNARSYCDTTLPNEFGYSLSYDINKGLYFAGAPAASLVKAPITTGGVVKSLDTLAKKAFIYEGVVKISSYNDATTNEKTEMVLVSPWATASSTATHARFGHSIYTSNVLGNTSTTLLVGAPGDSINTYTGRVYAYSVSRSNYYKATRAQVIYALAANLLAPLYYGEITILNWMTVGLKDFDQFHVDYRIAHPDEAEVWDNQRIQDAIGTVETRADVIAAYQNNVHAQLYPDEDSIRYWMIHGLGPNRSIFNNSVEVARADPVTGPKIIADIKKQRDDAFTESSATIFVGAHPSGIELNSHVPLNYGSQFGDKIVGNITGTTIVAITAPYYVNTVTNTTGIIQLFNTNLSWFNTIPTPFGTNDVFGNSIAISSNGSYLFASSTNVNVSENARGKVAVYKLSGTGNVIISSRSAVILAYATNLLAPVHPTEAEIQYWMFAGLGTASSTFNDAVTRDRATNPSLAAIIDQERAADAVGIVNTRAEVIAAYHNNLDAPLYPDEDSIRFWMLNGLGAGNSTFDYSVNINNLNYPELYSINLNVRDNAQSLLDYTYTLHQVIDNPLVHSGLKFGTTLSISEDTNTLVISALGTNNSETLTFDVTSKNGETTFDGGITKFTANIPNSGVVYVYGNLNGYFVLAEKISDPLALEGNGFGYSVLATNNNVFVGSPSSTTVSRIFEFGKIDSSISSGLKILREQTDLVDISTIDRVALIDSFKEELVEYLDVIDPLKGKIAGIAEQELKYKSAFDPATYSIGTTLTIIDTNTSWIDDHIGELWWDLSTAKYQWYEQGDEIFRRNNWGKLFPGSSIDVYEWVKSDLLPSEWAAQADTNDGLTKGISGQPKYPDNTVVSVKQLFNNVTGAFENVYFFWVKNKVTVPDVKNRRISSYQVSTIISDPVANGLKFAEILSADSIAFANVQPMLVGDRINANIAINSNRSEIPRHTEWMLMAEGNDKSMPPALLEKKLIDSLLGHDYLGNPVPSILSTYRNRYGIGIRPQQTLFKNRVEALRNQIDFANSILIKERVTGNYNFNNLNRYDPVPDALSREYDIVVDTTDELNSINTQLFEQALIICSVNNGKIISVEILTAGYGYTLPPLVTVVSPSGNNAVILTEINSDGQVINVVISDAGSGYVTAPQLIVRPQTVIIRANSNYNGRWTKHEFNYVARTTDNKWTKIKNQTYNTALYWDYVDWSSENYSQYKDYKYVIDGVYGLSTLENIVAGDYVKINNVGDGRYVILERLSSSEIGDFSPHYNFVYSEKGTIQISESLWKFSDNNVAYDDATLEETLYDQIPDIELYYILIALKDDIFIKNLKVNWNKFFFAAVKYALTEQKLLDWAFKTSFINVVNSVGTLDQRPVYKLDNEKYFEDYVNEVKPYHTNIRTYASRYTSLEENSTLSFTDFDSPETAWSENYTYCVGSIIVANPGTLYTQIPTVTITGGGDNVTSIATAEAYIRNGGVYQILVTNPGAGYTETPTILISGGGIYVTVTATSSVSLLNQTTRKNIIGMKFDRISVHSEIGNIDVNDTFVCSGVDDKFALSVLADRNKIDIVATLDGKLIFTSDYTIEYYSEKQDGYTQHYSKFVFLNYVPKEGQVFEISYKKNINLYTAVDRIEQFYTATDSLSSLMSGVVYPNNLVQGLPFEYSTAWDAIPGNTKYDISAWSDVVSYYASAKLVKNVNSGTSTLYLSTTTDIYPGQVINILNSTTNRVRADTVVVSVNTGSRSITISQPYYVIKNVKSTATNVGADIVVTTALPFNGSIVSGDTVTIAGISSAEFNGQYSIVSISDNDKFIIHAKTVLSTTATIITYGEANATISTMPVNINTASVLISHTKDTYSTSTASTIVVDLMTPYREITKVKIFKDNSPTEMLTGNPLGSHPSNEYYQLTIDSITNSVIANFYQMSNSTYNLEFFVYTDPTIEFWKTDVTQGGLDSTLPGGNWSWGNFVGGQGVTFTSTSILSTTTVNIIDGDSFLNERSSYAPEECVAGHVLDSLGINVYTKEDNSYPTVMSGSFPVTAGATPSATLSISANRAAGMMVHYAGKILDRVANNTELSSSNEYYMIGNTIYLGPQTVSGRGGYTMITVGGDYSVLDNNMETVYSGKTATVISLMSSINDVHGTYVLVDGTAIDEITQEEADAGAYGYVVGPYSNTNNRASVTVYDLSQGTHTVEAWFFESKYTKFNRVHEEILDAGTSQTMFELGFIPGNIEPVSAQVIVELFNSTTGRKRLLPPWVSYYQVASGNLTFSVDNKHIRPPNTYSSNTVFVYANGVKLRPGFDYTLNVVDSTVTIINGLLNNGDAIAVVGLIDYDYVIDGDMLELTTPVSNVSIKVTSFTDHDKMLIKTERFNGTLERHFTLSFPTLSDDYVWVYVDGIPLTARNEFDILDDARTIEISDLVTVTTASSVVITTINPPSFGNQIVGFRVFNDMFNRSHFKRLSAFHSTTLLQPLRHTDDTIVLTDGNGIIPPNPLINKPGIVIIDGERIEFMEKDGNVLKQLRRSTLGTGPATFSNIGTQVFDQSSQQTMPYTETTLIQTTSTTSTNYIISAVTTTATGAGIVLDPSINAVDQVTVYYGGRQLRKTLLEPTTAYILIVGQSNIGNYGDHTDSYTPDSRVQRLDINGNWEPAISPAGPNRLATGYNWNSGSAASIPGGVSGGNMDGRIGDELLQSGNYDKVYIVNISVGGADLKMWLSNTEPSYYPSFYSGIPRGEDNFPYTDTKLYERLQFAVNKADKSGFKFTHVLLGIGESDATFPNFTSFEDYQGRFSQFRNDLRMLGVDAPIYISKTSYTIYDPWNGSITSTNSTTTNAQQNIVDTYSDVYLGPNTDNYGDIYRWDHLHFKTSGLNAIGNAWGNTILTTFTGFNPNAPEFSINTSTNQLSLNIPDYNGITTDITIVQRKGQIWTGTESLLTSNVIQAEFLRKRKSILPDIYYYGGESVLRDNNNIIITDDNNQPLEGY